ncbi:MAG: glycosyltransferase family 2 protein, partial [bacterium]|nr:glycosyltransferase family 2 protein [bacterium]
MPDQPLVCFVLVNWRTEQFLEAALASIRAQTHTRIRTVLVNNASPTWNTLEQPPEVDLLLQAEKNLGFAGGTNLGISAVLSGEHWPKPDFVCLLNCDAWIEQEFIENALLVLSANPLIGSVVPKLMRDDGTHRIESAGHQMYTDRTTAHRGHDESDQGHYDRGEFVFGGSAAAIVYRSTMLEQIADGVSSGRLQVFDETFFAYYEDVDLDWRAQLCGWQAYYEPRCTAWHKSHGSGGRGRKLIQLRAEKNRYLMLIKNDRIDSLADAVGPLLAYELYHLLRWLLKPWLWPAPLFLLRFIPDALRKRVASGSEHNVKRSAISKWFVPRGLAAPPRPEPPDPNQARPIEKGLVSVVVLNYNGMEMTRDCMDSLYNQTYSRLDIVLVDNGSDEIEAMHLGSEYSNALMLPRNLGFAGGVNWGVSQAAGEYIALVNNDAALRPDCIEKLVLALETSDAAAVSGRLVNVESEVQALALAGMDDDTIATLGQEGPLVHPWRESGRNNGLSLYGFVVPSLYGESRESFYPSGGLCLLRRSSIEAMLPRLFPQLYFAYHEDVWLGYKLRSQGMKVIKEPAAVAAHVEGSTSRRLLNPAWLRFLQDRNRWLNILGFYPRSVLLRLLPILLLQELAMSLLALVTTPTQFGGLLAAQIWLLLHP